MKALKEKAPVGAEAQSKTLQADIKFCSGFGQLHTNKATSKNRKPYLTLTMAELEAMVKDPQSVEKENAQWMLASALPSRVFKEQEQNGQFWALWADFDQDPKPISEIASWWKNQIGAYALLYSSRSATPERQKSRLIVPLAQPLPFNEWEFAAIALNDDLERNGFTPDRTSERAAQLCYLPNRGDFYEFQIVKSKSLDAAHYFALEIDSLKQMRERERLEAENRRRTAALSRERFIASGKRSAVTAFNECHSIEDVLEKAGYEARGSRYRHPQSESGSHSASVKDGRVFSLSPNDPLYTGGAGNGAHDAFSAWAVLFFGGDMTAAAAQVHELMRRAGK